MNHQRGILDELRRVGAELDQEILLLVAQIEEYIKLNKESLADEYREGESRNDVTSNNEAEGNGDRVEEKLEVIPQSLTPFILLSKICQDFKTR